MSEGLTLDDLSVPLRAVRLLAADFGHLPAPVLEVTDIFPNRLKLRFHDGLDTFESWRAALGIAPDAVTHGTQNGGGTRVLQASVEYAGATLELVAFGQIPASGSDGGAA
ncbi:hypothetical protein BFF78_17725 [Streptomyces fodineus]|uniref:Uncharacterized protein n=1 Tax=Streptomyces fodineus TaxID=1904616 RepID=A0A1D7YB07_9ACTN|nr:hypothetical protein [Streptomyces fodineus]AOR32656.1 hypothetical protein BFF78_17725 [Streptomyces fodineus]